MRSSLSRSAPIRATFKLAGTLSDLNPPHGYTLTGEGKGGVAGFAKGSAKVRLEPDGDATILHYEVSAHIGHWRPVKRSRGW